jgi:hypothetical protein
VVYEVNQALHKVSSFTNKFPNPLQKWSHGTWAAQWIATEGEHVCQLYVSVIAPEQNLRNRKEMNFEWRQIPAEINEQLTSNLTEEIQVIASDNRQWQDMIGTRLLSSSSTSQTSQAVSNNPFSVLSEEETHSS